MTSDDRESTQWCEPCNGGTGAHRCGQPAGYTEEDVQRGREIMIEAVRASIEDWPGAAAKVWLGELHREGRLRDLSADRFKVGDLAATLSVLHERVEGWVSKVADDGVVTIEVPQVGSDYRVVPPMVITGPATEFAKVEAAGRLLPADARQAAAEIRAEVGRLRGEHKTGCECPACCWDRGAEAALRSVGLWVPVEPEPAGEPLKPRSHRTVVCAVHDGPHEAVFDCSGASNASPAGLALKGDDRGNA